MINSCNSNKPSQAQLLFYKTLDDFSSASAIEYAKGKLYVFGDDVPHLLILDTNYNMIDTLQYFSDSSLRMGKSEKIDLESATFIDHNSNKRLFALSSFSTNKRMSLFQLPLAGDAMHLLTHLPSLFQELKDIPELNIEGLAAVRGQFVLANRANKKHPVNKLIIGNNNLKDFILSSIIDLRFNNKNVVGISGLFYVKERDILLFTASEENTHSATDDGAISDSYIGWIDKFSEKIKQRSLEPSRMIKLSSIDKSFAKQKVESVCVQKINGKEMILHLVSDNDDGKSGLFKIKLEL